MIQTFDANPQITNAAFKLWAGGLSAALAAFGWVKTADTGQIDIATYAGTPASSSNVGYEVWRMDDSLQATAPVFMKIIYGTDINSNPKVDVQVGAGTNNAGTLTGRTSPANQNISSSSPSATNMRSHASGASDRFAVALFLHNVGDTTTAATGGCGFNVERTKDANGNNTTEGVCLYIHGSAASNNKEQTVSFTTVASMVGESQPFSLAPPTSAVAGLDVGVFPHHPLIGKLLPPKTDVLSYMHADIVPVTQFQVTIASVARNYLALGYRTNYSAGVGYQPSRTSGTATSVGLAMRYD